MRVQYRQTDKHEENKMKIKAKELVHVIEFNTGRPYTPEGQIIECRYQRFADDENIDFLWAVFHDKSRNIYGFIDTWLFESDDDIESNIMQEYDANRYHSILPRDYPRFEYIEE